MNIDPAYLPMIDLLGKGLATLLLAFGIQTVWRKLSAAQRSLVWLAAFAVLAVLPLSLLVQPQWEWKVGKPVAPIAIAALPVAAPLAVAGDVAVQAIDSPAPSWWQSLTPTSWALGIWALGGALILGFRMIGGWQLRRLHRASSPSTNKRLHHHLEWLAEELEVRRAIDVRESAATSVPLTWGWLKPVLLLPAEAATWEDEKLDAALRHELGHMRHHDACTRWLATVVCAVWWPVPPVWMAMKAWKLEQEKACDDLVLRAGATAQDYAMQLLHAARSFSPAANGVMAMARPSTLETRLRAVMDEKRNRRPMNTRAWAVSSVAAMLMACLCLMAQLKAASPAARDKQVGLALQFLNVPKADLKGSPLASGVHVLSAQELSALWHPLEKTSRLKVTTYPAMVGWIGEPIIVKSMVSDAAKTNWAGFQLTGIPTLRGNRLHLDLNLQSSYPKKQGSTEPLFEETVVKASETVPEGQAVALTGIRTNDPDRVQICIVTASLIPINANNKVIGIDLTGADKPVTGAMAQPSQTAGEQSALFQQVAKLMPDKSVHLTSVEMKDGRIIIVGEAPSMAMAARVRVNLTQPPFTDYRWKMPAPSTNAAGQSVFRAEGTPAAGNNSVPAAAKPGAALGAAESMAGKLVLNTVKFRDASLTDALDFLRTKSHDLDPNRKGLNIVVVDTIPTSQITLDLIDVPLNEALKYTVQLAGMEVSYQADAAIVHKPGAKPAMVPSPK